MSCRFIYTIQDPLEAAQHGDEEEEASTLVVSPQREEENLQRSYHRVNDNEDERYPKALPSSYQNLTF